MITEVFGYFNPTCKYNKENKCTLETIVIVGKEQGLDSTGMSIYRSVCVSERR